MALLTPQQQLEHDEQLERLIPKEVRDFVDQASGEELKALKKQLEIIELHEVNKHKSTMAKINARRGYINGKLHQYYNPEKP